MARFKMTLEQTRNLYIPKDADVETIDNPAAMIVRYDNNGPCAVMFGGRRSKPDNRYRYPTEERREEHIAEWLDGLRMRQKDVSDRRKERNAGHDLTPGDILSTSWGYDQTNVEFYLVAELRGKTMVRLVPICEAVTRTHTTSENVVADPDNIRDFDVLLGLHGREQCAKGRWKRASKHGVSLPHSMATKWDGKAKYQTAWGFGH